MCAASITSAAGQLGQVDPVPAADLGHRLRAGQRGKVDHGGREVDLGLLVGINRLPGGQVLLGPVLNSGEVGPVRQQLAVIDRHGSRQ